MIRYALRCDRDHKFDSWFRDSASFDQQVGAGYLVCPVCGSAEVAKSLMSPAVRTGGRRAAPVADEPTPTQPEAATPQPVALIDDRAVKLRAMLREMRDFMVQHSVDVGPSFAAEARKIHDGEAEKRAIRGEASPDEVRDLLEDGIEIMPVPAFPDDRH